MTKKKSFKETSLKDIWMKCPWCKEILYRKEVLKIHKCPKCNKHIKMDK